MIYKTYIGSKQPPMWMLNVFAWIVVPLGLVALIVDWAVAWMRGHRQS